MKHLAVIITAFFFTTTVFAQNAIDKHFNSYKEKKNVSTLSVKSKMFEMAAYIEVDEEDQELQELKDFIATIDAFDMIVEKDMENPKSDYTNGLRKVESGYEELMNVEDKEGSFTFFIDEAAGVVYELVMVGMGENEFVVFSLTGQMDLRELSRLSRKIQTDGFDHMNKIFDHGADQVKVYPNPASSNGSVTVEIPDEMSGASVNLINMNGANVKSFKMGSARHELSTSGLASGSYIVEIRKENVSIKKRLIVQ